MKGLGDEAVQVIFQEAPDRAKAEYIVARRGTLVAAVGDEELVLDPATPSDKLAPLKLTKDEKLQLAAWLTNEVGERKPPAAKRQKRQRGSQEGRDQKYGISARRAARYRAHDAAARERQNAPI